MSGKRFVRVPTECLVEALTAVGEKVKAAGGDYGWHLQGRERVFWFKERQGFAEVRVYTSIAMGEAAVRGCGEDAIRIVVGVVDGSRFAPTGASKKMLRTAPTRLGEDRRVRAFTDRLVGALREAARRARGGVKCPACGKPMVERKGQHGAFLGCLGYPECKQTRRIA